MPTNPNRSLATGTAEIRLLKETSILRLLAYFDIFQYPLTAEEISRFLDKDEEKKISQEVLRDLLFTGKVFLHNAFYSIQNNPLLVYRRLEGNKKAEKMLRMAYRAGRLLYRFPFVRAVAVSGSLSKNFANEKADIDFFIITKANRLWIARTIMHLFKKLTFLAGRQHWFCMNYYVDEIALEIENKNMYTAVEIATLIPVRGEITLEKFFEANTWVRQFLPRFSPVPCREKSKGNSGKRILEWLLDNRFADRLESWLQRITTTRWIKKRLEGRINRNGQTMHLETGRHFCRSNPGGFQERIVAMYQKKLAELK